MGVYSELDIEQSYEDSPFEESTFAPAFTEATPAEAAVIPPAAKPIEAPQQQVTTPPLSAPVQETGLTPAQSTDDAASQAAEPAEDAVSDEDKKKAHEEAEAKRKAEFEARQAAKKAAEQEQLDKLETMSAEELLTASMQRVSADTEKLTRRNMMECVAEYIQTMCIEDPSFARKVMHPRKNMIRCYQYINRKAWEYVQDELKAKNITPSRNDPYASAIPDDVCYQWAVDYFNDPDAKEDHEEEEKFVPKPYIGGSTSKSTGTKKAKDKAKDKKADTSKKAVEKPAPKKPAESTGQLTLGDFVMPEEKAG